jgi:hypothetical protein
MVALSLPELVPDVVLLRPWRRRETFGRVLVKGDDLGDCLRVSCLLLARDAGVLQKLLPLLRQALYNRKQRESRVAAGDRNRSGCPSNRALDDLQQRLQIRDSQ